MGQILKWAGSKRNLIEELLEIAKPAIYGRVYAEPFFGSGSLFFALEPTRAIVADVAAPLMEMYLVVSTYPDKVSDHLEGLGDAYNRIQKYESRESFYYTLRYNFNSAHPGPERAAWFIFLNKACFNGLYRENSSGEFNVPFGKRARVALPSRQDLHNTARALQTADIRCGDFEDVLIDAPAGAFVYADPPYDDTFTDYAAGGFSDDDQRRLAQLVGCLTDYGVYCMVSNSNTERVRELYKPFVQHRITANRSIAADSEARGEVQELVITNFDSEGRLL